MGEVEVGKEGGTGWGGMEGWGENADNCNWIKILKILKIKTLCECHFLHYYSFINIVNLDSIIFQLCSFILKKLDYLCSFISLNILESSGQTHWEKYAL